MFCMAMHNYALAPTSNLQAYLCLTRIHQDRAILEIVFASGLIQCLLSACRSMANEEEHLMNKLPGKPEHPAVDSGLEMVIETAKMLLVL